MALAHPALSLSGKKKGKQKFKSSEAKRAVEALESQWQSLKIKHESKPVTKKVFKQWEYTLSAPPGRTTSQHIPSRGDGTGVAAAKETKVYTGTEMVGISIIHKSCLQPVFSQEAATDAANMRR
jgi:hypothetical protein